MGGEAAKGAGERGAELAYEAIAPVYDAYTAHHDYEGWLSELLPTLERRGLRGNRLLDVGCGTGKSFLPMLPRGWEVTGCDVSASMLERARAKVGDGVKLSVADMRELPVFGEFDLVWSLDDAVNYLLDGEEFEQALRGMRANLAPTGLLLFDVNTLLAYRTFFAETVTLAELEEGRRAVWRGEAMPDTPAGSISEASLAIANGKAEASRGGGELLATHRQRHYPEAEVLAIVERAGLECLDVYGHGLDGVPKKPLDETVHTKAIFIARAG
jgi:SAM-dependent methyltransferase